MASDPNPEPDDWDPEPPKPKPSQASAAGQGEDAAPPSIDSTELEVGRWRSYPDWREDETFLVSGPIHPKGLGTGRAFTWVEARRWTTQTYGRIVHSVHIPASRRWCFRVPLPTAPGGRYTPPPESSLPARARRSKR